MKEVCAIVTSTYILYKETCCRCWWRI